MNKKTNMDKNKKRDIEHRKGHLAMAVAVGVLLALTGVSAASASDPGDARGTVEGWAQGCAEQFELAQRTDMESFRDYDRETFREGHDPRAVTIFASGAVRYGIDAIMAALESHFANREAIWAWTELYRVGRRLPLGLHPVRRNVRHPVDRLPPAHADRRDIHARRQPMAVDRRPGDVPRSSVIDVEQPGVREDEPPGCSTVNVAISVGGSPNSLIGTHSPNRSCCRCARSLSRLAPY